NQIDTEASHVLRESSESCRVTMGDPLVEHDVFALDQATLAHANPKSRHRWGPTGCHDAHNMLAIAHHDILRLSVSICLDGGLADDLGPFRTFGAKQLCGVL